MPSPRVSAARHHVQRRLLQDTESEDDGAQDSDSCGGLAPDWTGDEEQSDSQDSQDEEYLQQGDSHGDDGDDDDDDDSPRCKGSAGGDADSAFSPGQSVVLL